MNETNVRHNGGRLVAADAPRVKRQRTLRNQPRPWVRLATRLAHATGLYIVLMKVASALLSRLDYRSVFALNVRPTWLFTKGLWNRELRDRFVFCDPDRRDDFHVVPRIVSTFCANTEGQGASLASSAGVAPVWARNLSDRWKPLLGSLLARDEAAAFELFSRMFREDFIWGLTYGAEVDRWPHRRPMLALNILGALVEMGEALGIARTETPEQGVPAWALRHGPEPLVRRIEDVLGTPIGFPEIGAAYGIRAGERLLIQGQLAHVYAAWLLGRHADQLYRGDRQLHIVEIGGGYGGLCYWAHRLCGPRIASYTIVDLPSTGTVQAYFLSRAFGSGEAVALYDRTKGSFDTQATIRLVPHTDIDRIGQHVHFVINQDSFPELPRAEVERYIGWIAGHSDYFLSINQEAYSPVDGAEQVWVAQLCGTNPALRRVSRARTWVRQGYVEELYQVVDGR